MRSHWPSRKLRKLDGYLSGNILAVSLMNLGVGMGMFATPEHTQSLKVIASIAPLEVWGGMFIGLGALGILCLFWKVKYLPGVMILAGASMTMLTSGYIFAYISGSLMNAGAPVLTAFLAYLQITSGVKASRCLNLLKEREEAE